MSDLQCPATILLLTPETAALSDMREYRLARVLVGHGLAAISFGTELERAELTDAGALRASIAELADMYRGEQVAIIASAQPICELLHLREPPTAAIALAVDSDGWRILSR